MTERSQDFIQVLERLKEICEQLRKTCRDGKIPIDDYLEKDIDAQLEHFDLVVYGKYNAGKSSLLNLLLSLDLSDRLPVGPFPTTHALWKIGFSKQPLLCGKSFEKPQPTFGPLKSSIAKMLTHLASEKGKEEIANSDYLDIRFDVPWLERTGWHFWDTPGEDDPEGLLDWELLPEALDTSEGVILVTNYTEHSATPEYLEKLLKSSPKCLILVLSNSENLLVEDFSRDAQKWLKEIENYLRKSLLLESIPFIRFVAVDSKNVRKALDDCSSTCGHIHAALESWRTGEVRSADSFVAAADRMNNASKIVEKGGLFNLWSVLEEVRQVEEPILLMKALAKVRKEIALAIESISQAIAEISAQTNQLESEVDSVQSKIKERPIFPLVTKLSAPLQDQTEETIIGKCIRFREKAERILNEEILASEPPLKKQLRRAPTLKLPFLKEIDLGHMLGGGREDDHERFMNSTFPKLQAAAVDFISESIWKFISPIAIQQASELTKDSSTEYQQRVGIEAKVPSSTSFIIEKPSAETFAELLEKSSEKIQKILSDPNILSSVKVQRDFANKIENEALNVFNKVIRLISGDLMTQMKQALDEVKLDVRSSLQQEIDRLTGTQVALEAKRVAMNSRLSAFSALKIDIVNEEETQKGNIDRISKNHPSHETH